MTVFKNSYLFEKLLLFNDAHQITFPMTDSLQLLKIERRVLCILLQRIALIALFRFNPTH